MPGEFRVIQNVAIAGMLATPLAFPRQRQVNLFSKSAHPADLPGRRSDHHGPVFRTLGKGRSGREERACSAGNIRNNRRIRTERRSGPHKGLLEDSVSIDGRARKRNMSEDHVRRAKNEIFQLYVRKDRDGISQPARVANNRVTLDVSILAQAAILADDGARGDMREIPNFSVLPDLRTVLDDGGRMDEYRSILLRFDHKDIPILAPWLVRKGRRQRASRIDNACCQHGSQFYINKSI
jgi:hypothetical protein